MTDQTLTDVILKELASLSETRQADVLAFVRFLKIGLADAETTMQQFDIYGPGSRGRLHALRLHFLAGIRNIPIGLRGQIRTQRV